MADETVGAVAADTELQNNSEVVEVAEPQGGDPTPQDNANEGEQKHDENKRKGGWQRKIEKQQRTIEALVEQLTKTGATPAKETPKSAPEPVRKPTPNDFVIDGTDTYDQTAYLEAVADWKVEQRLKDAEAKREESRKTEEAKSSQQKAIEAWRSKHATTLAKHDDYDEAIGSADVVVSPLMHEAIMTSDVGAELAYFFATNEDEALNISRMNSYQAARAIGAIEAKFAPQESAAKEEADKPVEPPPSKAPAPITPVSRPSAAARPFDPVADADLPYKEWVKKREAQLNRKK